MEETGHDQNNDQTHRAMTMLVIKPARRLALEGAIKDIKINA